MIRMDIGHDCAGRVAVTIDGSRGSVEAFPHAVATARQRHGRLTIIAVAPRPWIIVGLGGICPLQLTSDMIEYVDRVARQLTAEVPADVPCTTVLRCGNAARETARYLREHPHDVLITGARGRWRRPGPRADRSASGLVQTGSGAGVVL